MTVHSSFICKTQKLKTTQISINKGMYRLWEHPYNGILLINKMEQRINTRNNLDGSQGHYTE